MPELPNAHPGAPLTVWLRCSRTTERWYQSTLDNPPLPDAVEYVRKDVCDAWLEHEANTLQRMQLRTALAAALEALEDDDPTGATAILRTCLSRL